LFPITKKSKTAAIPPRILNNFPPDFFAGGTGGGGVLETGLILEG